MARSLSVSVTLLANVKISDLPVAVALTGTESVPIVQSGQTVQTTPDAIGAYATQASFLVVSSVGETANARALAVTSGDLTASDGGAGADLTLALADTAVSPGTYGDATHVPQIIIDAKGRITSAANISVSGSGTVTSVALTAPVEFTVSGSPVTSAGTLALAWANQSANTLFAGPANGSAASPGFRTMVTADIPANGVTNAKLAQMAAHTLKGNNSAATANAADLTGTQATALLDAFVGDSGAGGTKGLVPAPATGDSGKFLKGDGTWGVTAAGTVTSVGLSLPAQFSVSGSPVTSSGALTASWASQTANTVLAAPDGTSGTPTFRALGAADISAALNALIAALPTTLPASSGVLWNNGGVLSVS